MGSLQSEISKTLNQWDIKDETTVQPQVSKGLPRQIFDYVQANPSCTCNEVVAGTGIDIARVSTLLLNMYNKGKLGRKEYLNPDPDSKRTHVFVYWAEVNSYSDKGLLRKAKAKKPKVSAPIMPDIFEFREEHRPLPRMKQFADEFNPETFVQDLSLKEAKAVYEVLKGYFSG